MLSFVAALTLASLSTAGTVVLDVPFVPQTGALCGGAAAAMVMRYLGDAHADAQQFAPLVVRRDGVSGIGDRDLGDALRARGWRTERVDGSLAALRARIEARQPVIVLLSDRRDTYHYVVVVAVGDDAVVIHDPAWGPHRSMPSSAFTRIWTGWALALEKDPPSATKDTKVTKGTKAVSSGVLEHCDVLLDSAVEQGRSSGIEHADEYLERVRAECPASAGPLRELAGVRLAQKRWADASVLARQALELQPKDEYALDVLGTSLFVQDDVAGALRAWNQIGRPTLDLVRVDGLTRSRYQTIIEAVALKPRALLTADDFLQATHRLNDLPNRVSSRLTLRPEQDGFADVDLVINERPSRPHGWTGWTAAGTHAAINREASIALPGTSGQGEVWSASWRWWANRPRVGVGFAAPRVGGLPGVWRVGASWEAETFALDLATMVRQSRTHGDLTVSDWATGTLRYGASIGVDSWSDGRKAASFGGSLERRWINDRLSASIDETIWVPIQASRTFSAAGLRVAMTTATEPRPWVAQLSAGVQRVSDDAPFSLWPGAGEGRARATLLRAHPLLDDGVIETRSAFGRSLISANAEAQRWLTQPRLVRVGFAAFVDVARATRRLTDDNRTYADAGAGLRIRIPGTEGTVRIDAAHGLRDGANALTIGWIY